jgi:hypothetical protein
MWPLIQPITSYAELFLSIGALCGVELQQSLREAHVHLLRPRDVPELLRARETRVRLVGSFSRDPYQTRPDSRRQHWYPPQTVDELTR